MAMSSRLLVITNQLTKPEMKRAHRQNLPPPVAPPGSSKSRACRAWATRHRFFLYMYSVTVTAPAPTVPGSQSVIGQATTYASSPNRKIYTHTHNRAQRFVWVLARNKICSCAANLKKAVKNKSKEKETQACVDNTPSQYVLASDRRRIRLGRNGDRIDAVVWLGWAGGRSAALPQGFAALAVLEGTIPIVS